MSSEVPNIPNKINISALYANNKVNNSQKEAMVLDEATGFLIPAVCTSMNEGEEENVDSGLFINMHLDETTGLFVIDSDQSVSSQSVSITNQTDSATSDVSPPRLTTTILNEHSGIISKERPRKNQGDSKSWERNKLKKAREEGKAYFSISRKKNETTLLTERNERKLKPRCTSEKCAASKVKKCNEILEKIREKIFISFWKDLNWDQRQSYVTSLVTKEIISRKDNSKQSRRNFTFQYYLLVNNRRLLVCKKMFLNTLSLGEFQVLNWVKKSNDFGLKKK